MLRFLKVLSVATIFIFIYGLFDPAWLIAQSASQTLDLKQGFNFVSFVLKPDLTAQQLIAQNAGLKEIYSYNTASGSFLSAGDQTLTALSAGKGYIINSESPMSLAIQGTAQALTGNITLKKGFNLVGFSKAPESIKFSSLLDRCPFMKGLYKWNAGSGSFVQVVRSSSSVVQQLDGVDPQAAAGQSYFINMYSDAVINYDGDKINFVDGSTAGARVIQSIETASGAYAYWNDTATWTGGIIPGEKDDVVINGLVIAPLGTAAMCNNLTVSRTGDLRNFEGTADANIRTVKIKGNFTNLGKVQTMPPVNLSGSGGWLALEIGGTFYNLGDYHAYSTTFNGAGVQKFYLGEGIYLERESFLVVQPCTGLQALSALRLKSNSFYADLAGGTLDMNGNDIIVESGTFQAANGKVTNAPRFSGLPPAGLPSPEYLNYPVIYGTTFVPPAGSPFEMSGTVEISGTASSGPTAVEGDLKIPAGTIIQAGVYGDDNRLNVTGKITNNGTVRDNPTFGKVIYVNGVRPPATPVFTVKSGAYSAPLAVGITCETAGAKIYYTLDGSQPSASSSLYSGTFELSVSSTVKALAFSSDGGMNSGTAAAAYEIKAAAPVFSFAAQTAPGVRRVSITSATQGALIYYTFNTVYDTYNTDAEKLQAFDKIYTGEIEIVQAATISAIAVKPGAKISDVSKTGAAPSDFEIAVKSYILAASYQQFMDFSNVTSQPPQTEEGGYFEITVTAKNPDNTVDTSYSGSGTLQASAAAGAVNWEGKGISDNSAASSDNGGKFDNTAFSNGVMVLYVRNSRSSSDVKLSVADSALPLKAVEKTVAWAAEKTVSGVKFIGENSKGFRRYESSADTTVTFIKIPASPFDFGEKNDMGGAVTEIAMDSFLIAEYPVTNAQFNKWRLSSGAPALEGSWNWDNNDLFKGENKASNYPDHPAVNVSWNDARNYSRWLLSGSNSNNDPYDSSFFITTEAQYKKAMRGAKLSGAGNDAADKIYPWGKVMDAAVCNEWSVDSGDERWIDSGHTGRGTTAVSKYPAAGYYGLYDISGNISAWCQDTYTSDFVPSYNNPYNVASSATRVICGGNWYLSDERNFRCSYRSSMAPASYNNTVGVRPAVRFPLF